MKKSEILNTIRQRKDITFRNTVIGMTSNFLTERQWDNIFKCPKEKKKSIATELYFKWNHPSKGKTKQRLDCRIGRREGIAAFFTDEINHNFQSLIFRSQSIMEAKVITLAHHQKGNFSTYTYYLPKKIL